MRISRYGTEFQPQPSGKGPRDQLGLVISALALAVGMQRDGHDCVGLKFLACFST